MSAPRGTLRENLRALPAAAWILFGGTFINRFGTFVMPFLVIYLTKQGYGTAASGIAVSAYGAGHICASMLGGHLADRIGRRNTIAISMFAGAASMIALSQASTYASILVTSVLVGAASELYRPAAAALIGDLVEPEQRITAFGVYRLAINLGFAAGPATAGFLAERSFLLLFIGDAITSSLYGVIALLFLPHGLRHHRTDESAAEGFRVALRDRAFVIFLISTLCITWIEFQVHSTLPLYITSLGFSNVTYGLLMSINGLMIVVFELGITAWTQRFPTRWMIAVGYAVSAIGFALTGLATNVPALAFTVMIWTIGEMIYAPVTGAYVADLAPEKYRGRYNGLWVLMWSIGMLLGPALGTAIFAVNPAALWIACAVIGCTGASLALIRTRPREVADIAGT
jgi:MFS family permease